MQSTNSEYGSPYLGVCHVTFTFTFTFTCSRAPQSWYWGRRESWTFTPPTYNSCRTWDSNSQPLDYESDSLTQGSPDTVLEGRCPAEFSSNPNQTHLKQLIKVSLGILETSREVCWGKLELNSAGHRPSRIKFDDPCSNHLATTSRQNNINYLILIRINKNYIYRLYISHPAL